MNKVVANHQTRQVGTKVLERIKALKIGQKMQDLPEELWHDSFRYYVKEDPTRVGGPNLRMIRLDPSRPSLTVTGYIFNKFVHPYEDRFVTPREAARLQGFPDEFEFSGTLGSVQLQVGNAVPVQLAHAVTQAVLEHACRNMPMGLGKDVYTNKCLPVLSLFSGAGGLDLGTEEASDGRARWQSRACVEYDADCCATLRQNFGKRVEVVEGDIRKIDPQAVAERCGLEKSVLPLIVGGPPCQAFSQAGKQKATGDPRGQLVFEFLRFVEILKPVYFVMENVYGLKGVAKGELMREILRRMSELGYNVNHRLLLAADFGAAQLRRRFFFVGVRKPYPAVVLPHPTHGKTESLFDSKPYVGVGEAFTGLPPVLLNGRAPREDTDDNLVLTDETSAPMVREKKARLKLRQKKKVVRYKKPTVAKKHNGHR